MIRGRRRPDGMSRLAAETLAADGSTDVGELKAAAWAAWERSGRRLSYGDVVTSG